MFPQMPMPTDPNAFGYPPQTGMAAAGLADPLGLAGANRGMSPGLGPMADVFLSMLTNGGQLPYQQVGGDPLMQLLMALSQQGPQGPPAAGPAMPGMMGGPPQGMMGGY